MPPILFMDKYDLIDGIIKTNFNSFSLQEFDKKYNPTWHCIVGRNFGILFFFQIITGGDIDKKMKFSIPLKMLKNTKTSAGLRKTQVKR
jgi:hypothetical protein